MAVGLLVCEFSTLVILYQIGEESFHLIGTNGFHVRSGNEKFTAVGSRCRQNLKFETVQLLFDHVKEMCLNACCTSSAIIFLIQPIISLLLKVVATIVDP